MRKKSGLKREERLNLEIVSLKTGEQNLILLLLAD
jgi:hypothetical protein